MNRTGKQGDLPKVGKKSTNLGHKITKKINSAIQQEVKV